jgi:glycosyltransferase involved in cell wall biosynthesis
MGRVVIEASSFGVPVIASNRGGFQKLLKKMKLATSSVQIANTNFTLLLLNQ